MIEPTADSDSSPDELILPIPARERYVQIEMAELEHIYEEIAELPELPAGRAGGAGGGVPPELPDRVSRPLPPRPLHRALPQLYQRTVALDLKVCLLMICTFIVLMGFYWFRLMRVQGRLYAAIEQAELVAANQTRAESVFSAFLNYSMVAIFANYTK